MNTQFTRAYMVTSALIVSLLTTGIMPATAYAASQAAQHRSDVAAARSNAPVRTGSDITTELDSPTPEATATVAAAPSTNQHAKSQTERTSTNTTSTHSPAGNNGFIKVNQEVVPDSTPNNDPHVSCQFKIEFYNYDQNPANRAHVSFALHNPTAGEGYSLAVSGNQNPVIGGDAASGGNDLDAIESYRLSFTGQSHPQQGYHVKLTINADGSRGADVKHKVFWVQPCAGQVLGSSGGGQTLSSSTTRETARVLPGTLPSTGTNPYGFVITLLASVLSYIVTYGAQKLRSLRTEA